jgi:hypothetical protein
MHSAARAALFEVLTVTHAVGAWTHRREARLHRHPIVRFWLRVVTVSWGQYGGSVTVRRWENDLGLGQVVGDGAPAQVGRGPFRATTRTMMTFETARVRPRP